MSLPVRLGASTFGKNLANKMSILGPNRFPEAKPLERCHQSADPVVRYRSQQIENTPLYRSLHSGRAGAHSLGAFEPNAKDKIRCRRTLMGSLSRQTTSALIWAKKFAGKLDNVTSSTLLGSYNSRSPSPRCRGTASETKSRSQRAAGQQAWHRNHATNPFRLWPKSWDLILCGGQRVLPASCPSNWEPRSADERSHSTVGITSPRSRTKFVLFVISVCALINATAC